MSSQYKDIRIRLKQDDYNKIRIQAEQAELTIAAYIRKLASVDDPSNYTKKTVFRTNLARYLALMNIIGALLNQIAKVLNSKKNRGEIEIYMLENISEINKSLKKLSNGEMK